MRGSGGGGAGQGRGSGPHRKITRCMGRSRSKPPSLTKFPGSAHGGGGGGGGNLFHWNALEQIA